MTEERKSLDLIGIDPGSVNLGVGCIRFFGLVDLVDDDGNVIKHLPEIEILAMERWDLERGIVYKPTKSMNALQSIPLVGHRDRSKKMMDWSDSGTQAIARANWMFEEFTSFLTDEVLLPILVIENQCDQHKTNFNKNEMTQVQSFLTASLQAIEHRDRWIGRPVKKRLYHQGMRKYGQRSDASRDRPERKEKGVDDLKELLLELGTVNALRWLAYLNYLESKREQIHDMCDAILLAVDKALALYEEHLKGRRADSNDKTEKAEIQKERKRIPLVPVQKRKTLGEPSFTDDQFPDEEDCAPLKKRKKRSPSEVAEAKAKDKEPKKVKRSVKPKSLDLTKETKVKEKRAKRKAKEPKEVKECEAKERKRKRTDPSEEGEESEPKKKRTYKKRAKKDEEFPKLLLDVTTCD